MADQSQLEQALINADKAGDTDAAKILAGELQKMRNSPQGNDPTNVGKTATDQVKRVAGAAVETPLHFVTGMAGAAVGGVRGIADLALGKSGEQAQEDIESTERALTYTPKTEGGKLGVQGLDSILGLIPKAGGKAGELTLKATGSPGAAAAVDTAVQALPMLAGARSIKGAAGAPKIDPIRVKAYEAQQEGIVLPANQARPNLLNNLADSVSGKVKTQQLASLKNPKAIQELVKRGLGVKPETEWSSDIPKQVRAEASKAYEALEDPSIPRVHPGTAFYAELNSVLGDYTEAGRSFKESAKSPIQDNIRALAKDIRDSKGFKPSEGIAMARILRDRASAASAKGDKAEGLANKRMANALEDEVERGLPKDKPDLIKNFRAARQRIAQSYSVEEAMNPATGNIDLRVLGRQLKNKVPLTGELKKGAEIGLSFPKAVQLPEQIGDYSDYSPLDYSVGIMAEAGSKAAGGNINEAGAVLSRAPLRHALLSDWYQKHLGRAPSPNELAKIQNSLNRLPKEKQLLYLQALSQDQNQ